MKCDVISEVNCEVISFACVFKCEVRSWVSEVRFDVISEVRAEVRCNVRGEVGGEVRCNVRGEVICGVIDHCIAFRLDGNNIQFFSE